MNDFNNLLDIVTQLRKECPWDKEQTHESLAKHLIEESYELLDTLSNLNDSPESFNDFKEELGDLYYKYYYILKLPLKIIIFR